MCGGYARRLYPITDFIPKSLLPIAGRPVLDHIIDATEDHVTKITISTNNRFVDQFRYYISNRFLRTGKTIGLLTEGTLTDENRLGIVGGLSFALHRLQIKDDLVVLHGDKIYLFDVDRFFRRCREGEYHDKIRILFPRERDEHEGTMGMIIPYKLITDKRFLRDVERCGSDPKTKDSVLSLIRMLKEHFDLRYMPIDGRSVDIGVIDTYRTAFEHFLESGKKPNDLAKMVRVDQHSKNRARNKS